jgi:hypothetical protein
MYDLMDWNPCAFDTGLSVADIRADCDSLIHSAYPVVQTLSTLRYNNTAIVPDGTVRFQTLG